MTGHEFKNLQKGDTITLDQDCYTVYDVDRVNGEDYEVNVSLQKQDGTCITIKWIDDIGFLSPKPGMIWEWGRVEKASA